MELHPELEPFRDRIRASVRRCARFSIGWGDEAPLAGSFFGGRASVVGGWPMNEYAGPLHFVAQVDLAEVPPTPGLPGQGLAQFFVSVTDGGIDWDYPEVRIVAPADIGGESEPFGDPAVEAWAEDDEGAADEHRELAELFGDVRRPLSFAVVDQPMTLDDERALATLGFDRSMISDEAADAYEALCGVDGDHWPAHQVGGYLVGVQGDPRDDPQRELLLRLCNDERLEWGDTGALQWFGTPGDLEFSEATT